MTDDRIIYELSGVSRSYSVGSHLVLAVREVDLVVERGEFLAVVGSSGSGKTTLLQLLGALDRPSEGEIRFEGRDLRKFRDAELTRLRATAFGFVFQQFNLVATLTAAQNVEAALVATGGMGRRDRRAHVEELLDRVGLTPRAHHLPSQLSGGEQQRVAIARALANAPRVILADEPTGNLDSKTGDEIVELLRSLSGEGAQTVVLITHDANIAARAHRIVRMHDGRLTSSVAGPALEAASD
jgi:ABC-type lipoprotein export system ATPase subunit